MIADPAQLSADQDLSVDLLLGEAGLVLRRFHQLAVEAREDLAQEAVLRTLEAGATNPAGFVRVTARNLAVDQLRRERRRRHEPLLELPTGVEAVSLDDQVAELESLIARAPTCYGETLRTSLSDEPVTWADPQARDAWYKRRERALDWARRKLGISRPRQTRAARQAVAADRPAQVLEYFRSRPGWHRTRAVRAAIRCTTEQVREVLAMLRAAGTLEKRGTTCASEYRLREGA